MKKIFYCLIISIFMFGCGYYDDFSSHIDYSEDEIFVESIMFYVDVIDVTEKSINSKEELVEYFNANYLPESSPYPYDSCFLKMVVHGSEFENDRQPPFNYVVYINPMCNGESVLNKTNYKNGMPIAMEYKGLATGYKIGGKKLLSKQRIILVKGDPVHWADSLFISGEKSETYTILPVSDGSKNNTNLNFTYKIERK